MTDVYTFFRRADPESFEHSGIRRFKFDFKPFYLQCETQLCKTPVLTNFPPFTFIKSI
jgi:hypothetical protein